MDKEFILTKKNGDEINVIWNDYESGTNEISILKFIEGNSDLIKREYLKIIEKIGFLNIKGKKLHEVFELQSKFSFWWITDVYEKSLYKHLSINEILKLIALEEVIKEKKIQKISISNYDEKLFDSIKFICKKNQILFTGKNKKKKFKIFFVFKMIFVFLNFLRFLSKRFSFTKTNVKINNLKNLFCSYFAYINLDKLNNNIYYSDYWRDLINQKKIIKNSHFLHIFFPSKKITFNDSIKAIKKVNKEENNLHFFVEEYFSIKIFFKIIFYWVRNILKFYSNRDKIKNSFFLSNLYSWYFLKDDLEESFCGISSLVNLYYFFLFKEISIRINSIDKTFFLYENQGWEKSFVFNLRKLEKNKIYGIQHSTVRYWDLRYSINIDKSRKEIFNKFNPDYFVVNGEDSLKKMLNNSYPEEKIKKAEAIRYLDIIKSAKADILEKKNLNSILIVGDYAKQSNLNISNSLNQLDPIYFEKFNFTLKEHPLREMSNLLKFNFKKSNFQIDKLRLNHDYAIVGNSTSAAIDLYLLGFKLIVIVDKNFVNFSPLKNQKNVIFLYNQNLLSNCIKEIDKIDEIDKKKQIFFIILQIMIYGII